MLRYCSHESDGVLVFTVEEAGPEHFSTTQREWLYKTIEAREDPKFVIDLGALNYIGSCDIGVLITLKRRVDVRKGKVVLVNVDPFIVDILRTMRIDKLFPMTPTMPEAVALLSA